VGLTQKRKERGLEKRTVLTHCVTYDLLTDKKDHFCFDDIGKIKRKKNFMT
jgi:hypothetical protein